MKVSEKNEIVEWGGKPKKDMILVGFSCNAILEGKDLKQEIIDILNEKDIGYRKAVMHFKKHGLASFDESKRIIDEIKSDLGRNKDQQKVFRKKYGYTISRVFWTYEKNIPDDPRYFKLNIIDMENMNLNNYINEDKSFNAEKFIRENISEKDIEKIKDESRKQIIYKEDAPKDDMSLADNEWNVDKK
jgi:hypothetical protein